VKIFLAKLFEFLLSPPSKINTQSTFDIKEMSETMSFDRGSSRTLTNAESLAKDSTSDSTTTASPRDVEAQSDLRLQSLSAPRANENGKGRVNVRIVSDAILGMSDGLTVPFALTAGLTVFNNARLVVLGGLAELIAGAISMGLGGYVGAKSEV
jgi:VIT family